MVSETNAKTERIPGQCFLPLARVKRIIKEDPEVTLINGEATHCVAAATELFMEYLVKEGFSRAQKNKRKTIFYKDLATAVSQTDQFEFLEDVIPQTMTLEEAYKRRKVSGNTEDSETTKMKPVSDKKQKGIEKSMESKQPQEEDQEENEDEEDEEDEAEDEEEEEEE
ncbi:histone-fold-containing protein, partial [Halteromyces radiatus]|uniref:histone-fold-containing protein n=1 Tax=Halteromyces radiatus TaxID=101107 RepID=UPI00222013DD